MALLNLGTIDRTEGALDRATARLQESLALFNGGSARRGAAFCLAALGGVAIAASDARRGAQLLGAAQAQLEAVRAAFDFNERIRFDADVAAARELLGDERFQREFAAGQAMPLERAVAYALDAAADGDPGVCRSA